MAPAVSGGPKKEYQNYPLAKSYLYRRSLNKDYSLYDSHYGVGDYA